MIVHFFNVGQYILRITVKYFIFIISVSKAVIIGFNKWILLVNFVIIAAKFTLYGMLAYNEYAYF